MQDNFPFLHGLHKPTKNLESNLIGALLEGSPFNFYENILNYKRSNALIK